MASIPKRVKANGGEKVQQSQQALRAELTTHPEVSDQMIKYMQSIKLKKDLGILRLNDSQLKELFPEESVQEKLTRTILGNLNKISTLSPEFLAISSVFGTSDKLALSQKIAARQVEALRVRNITARVMGVESNQVAQFGSVDVNRAINSSSLAGGDPMNASGSAAQAAQESDL